MSEPFTIMVAGTRTFSDYALLESELDKVAAQLGPLIVCTGEWRGIGYGTANYVGADLLAEKWAARRRFTVRRFPPDFAAAGRNRNAAFHARNREMVEHVAAVGGRAVVFWNGTSPGTASVIELLKKHQVKRKVFLFDEEG